MAQNILKSFTESWDRLSPEMIEDEIIETMEALRELKNLKKNKGHIPVKHDTSSWRTCSKAVLTVTVCAGLIGGSYYVHTLYGPFFDRVKWGSFSQRLSKIPSGFL